MPGTVYLVDYENVQERGLYGIRMLSADDTVHIIYTDNTNKISLDCVNELSIPLHTLHVPSGKQSLDMHLVSFLAYLIGTETDAETRYVVVSNDTDFDGVIHFWCDRLDIDRKVSRRGCISEEASWITPAPADRPDAQYDQAQALSDHAAVSHAIQKAINDAGDTDQWGCRRIDIAKLCTILNNLPEYLRERQRSGKKPQQMLKDEYADVMWISQDRKTTYAYPVLKKTSSACENSGDAESAEKDAAPVSAPEDAVADAAPASEETPAEPCGSRAVSPAETEEAPREAVKAADPVPLLPCANIIQALTDGGMDRALASLVAPYVQLYTGTGNDKVRLYNALRRKFGGIDGTRLYREVRNILDQPTHPSHRNDSTLPICVN